MNSELLSISVNWSLIVRCLAAVLWGVLWALALDHAKFARFLRESRTWMTVVIGIGVDLAISFGGDWWTVSLVIACSSIGIIARSLYHESQEQGAPSGYKVLWALEDIIATTGNVIILIEDVLNKSNDGPLSAQMSKCVRLAHRAHETARGARRGEYGQSQPVARRGRSAGRE